MEPRKFEDQIKHKLESREITPSPKSWEQLRAKLDKKEKKEIPLKWWLGIAASFIGGVLLVGIFYTTSEVLETPQVVDNTIKTESQQPILQTTDTAISQEEMISEKEDEQLIPKAIPQQTESKIVQATSDNTEDQELITTQTLTREQVVIAEKVEDLMTTISALEENNVPLTEEEVDVLLNKATQQILIEKQLKISTAQINANSLLEDVEMELDQSFREKIFEMLKDGFNKTRTAIATRND